MLATKCQRLPYTCLKDFKTLRLRNVRTLKYLILSMLSKFIDLGVFLSPPGTEYIGP